MNITKEIALYRIEAANKQLKTLIELGIEEDEAYAIVAQNLAGNMDEYNRIVGEVARDSADNMGGAAYHMADALDKNTRAAQTSMNSLQKKIWDVADAIANMAQGKKGGDSGTEIYAGGGAQKNQAFEVKRYKKTSRQLLENTAKKKLTLMISSHSLNLTSKATPMQ